MAKMLLLLVLATVLVSAGCKSNDGSRQFIPGKGWGPTK